MGVGVARALAFWRSLLVSTMMFRSFSPSRRASVQLVFHTLLSLARDSHESIGRLMACMSLFTTSLKRSFGLPTGLFPCTSSPYKRCLGMRPSSIRYTWPIHLRRLWRRRVNTEGMPALSKTALFVMRSCQEMERMCRKQHRWNTFRRFSCAAYVV